MKAFPCLLAGNKVEAAEGKQQILPLFLVLCNIFARGFYGAEWKVLEFNLCYCLTVVISYLLQH